MENNPKKCSLENHSDKLANTYCKVCSIYMCKKCERNHSELFKNHNPILLDKNINILSDDICKENGHLMQANYFCNSHKIYCCDLCISKIKTEKNGKHADCEVITVEEIKNKKIREFNEKIINLEKNNIILKNILEEMKIFMEKMNDKKEKIKLKIQKIFTEIRNALNNREDEIFEEIDKRFDDIYFTEDFYNENKKLNYQTKLYLEKNKNINLKINDIFSLINEIEQLSNNYTSINNKITELNILSNKCKNYETEIEFKPNSGGVGALLKEIRNFGDLYINENHNQKIYKCFKTYSEDNEVLLISNQKYQIMNNLLKFNERIKKIHIFHPDFIIPKLLYEDINKYKIIIYDFQDCEYKINLNNHENIQKYIENGGNIILTHDKIRDYMKLLNAKYTKGKNLRVEKAKILNNAHPVFKSHYDLDLKINQIINIDTTHRPPIEFLNKEEYSKELLIELEDGEHGEYLVIKEIGKGKLIYWNAGHLYYERCNPNLLEIEQRLFMNFIYWICN